jgi:hypothetical protein
MKLVWWGFALFGVLFVLGAVSCGGGSGGGGDNDSGAVNDDDTADDDAADDDTADDDVTDDDDDDDTADDDVTDDDDDDDTADDDTADDDTADDDAVDDDATDDDNDDDSVDDDTTPLTPVYGYYEEGNPANWAALLDDLPVFAAYGVTLFLGLPDTAIGDAGLADFLRQADAAGVEVRAWVLLPYELGYWPGEDNAEAFAAAALAYAA